jgi:hypothetical protein
MKKFFTWLKSWFATVPSLQEQELLFESFRQHLLCLTRYAPLDGRPLSLKDAISEVRGGRQFDRMTESIFMEAVAAVKARLQWEQAMEETVRFISRA